MKINYISTLPVLRELWYEKPRDMARFQWYCNKMLGEMRLRLNQYARSFEKLTGGDRRSIGRGRGGGRCFG
jgi:hypothetical protein